jgi:hypothetical protein
MDAPYFNSLMMMGAHATAYETHIHPSEPNYVWLEAGDNLNITSDNDPTGNQPNQLMTTDHLSRQLETAGISWRAYVENIDGTSCPLASSGDFAVKHTPQLFFSDETDNFATSSPTCIEHVRPFSQLATDLMTGTQARYNFITPNLCDDMHGALDCGLGNLTLVANGDTWLMNHVPTILGSDAFMHGGLLVILWDEGDEPLFQTASDGPLPILLLGNMVKANYPSNATYTHSSTLKTFQEIFGVPLLRGAADPATNDLSDMFTHFP